jgi:opacity protein-like surface antigen
MIKKLLYTSILAMPRQFLLIVLITGLTTRVFAEEQILNRSFESDKVFLDTLSLRIGSSKAFIDTTNVNGGVIGISEPDDSGINLSLTAVFSNDYAPSLKPYIEFTRISFDDRDLNIVGGGVRYDFSRKPDQVGFYLKGGLGYLYSNWTESPFTQPSAGLAGDRSFTVSLQGGLDYYFADHWAVDFNLRYDLYDLETTLVEASNANASTTWNESASFSALIGIVYQFQSGLSQTRAADDDGDGVENSFDNCSGSLPFVPILDNGCANSTFNFHLVYADGVFRLDNFVGKPDFNVVLFMRNHPEFKIKIIGYNRTLENARNKQEYSKDTARHVKQYLVDNGISAERIYAYGADDEDREPKSSASSSPIINRYILVEFFKSEV